jgi:hypothetical protein
VSQRAVTHRPKLINIKLTRIDNTGTLSKPLVDAGRSGDGTGGGQSEGVIKPNFGVDCGAIRSAISALAPETTTASGIRRLLRVQAAPHCENSNVCSHYAEPVEGHGAQRSGMSAKAISSSLDGACEEAPLMLPLPAL